MKIDRELQLQILSLLRDCYPAQGFTNRLAEQMGADHHHLCCNAAYLLEHDLLDGEIRLTNDGSKNMMPGRLTITAKGLDFIEEDGGLSAVLGTVTVRLHADSVRDLIAAQIELSELDSSTKAKLIDTVKTLPAQGLEAVVTGLAREGLARLPNAIHWLQTTLSVAP